MSKKTIIISIASIILMATIVVVVLLLIGGEFGKNNDDTATHSGDSVTIADTPDFKTCELVSTASIQQVLGDNGSTLSGGERKGIVSHNLEPADVCQYTFTVDGSVTSQLTFQTYRYLESDATEKTNIFDSSWRNIGSFNYSSYTLIEPTYYKKITEGSETKFVLQVLSGPRHYQFAISQPSAKTTYTDESAINTLTALAMKADYNVGNDKNAPPAPASAKAHSIPMETSTPEPHEGPTPEDMETDDPDGGVGDAQN